MNYIVYPWCGPKEPPDNISSFCVAYVILLTLIRLCVPCTCIYRSPPPHGGLIIPTHDRPGPQTPPPAPFTPRYADILCYKLGILLPYNTNSQSIAQGYAISSRALIYV